MNIYTRAANLKLNAYIYRYYILGGVVSYYYVPELAFSYTFYKNFARPHFKELRQQYNDGSLRVGHY